MPGLDTLPLEFVAGARASTDFDYISLGNGWSGGQVTGVAGGYFSSLGYEDLVWSMDGDLYWQQYVDSDQNFTTAVEFAQGSEATYIRPFDVNNDGFTDIVSLVASSTDSSGYPTNTSGASPTQFQVFLSTGQGSISGGVAPFAGAIQSTIDTSALNLNTDNQSGAAFINDFQLRDFNGDGQLDAIVAGVNVWEENNTSVVSIQGIYSIGLGDGQGHFDFQPLAFTSTTATLNGNYDITDPQLLLARVDAGDLDGDGNLDVAFGYHAGSVDTGEALNNMQAYVVWGDSTTSSDAPSLNFTSSNTYSNGWQGANDVRMVAPYYGERDALVMTFTSTAHIVNFNADKTLANDVKESSIPDGPLGSLVDYNADGWTDFMFIDGSDSTIGINFDWSDMSGNIDQYPSFGDGAPSNNLGTDIMSGDAVDLNGDGLMDWFGAYEHNEGSTQMWAYLNTTTTSSDAAQTVTLVEGRSVAPNLINSVSAAFMTGPGFIVDVIGGRSAQDNALGWFELRADGTFGDAQFIEGDRPFHIDGLADGSRLALFLVADGAALNEDLGGSFRFIDRQTGEGARLGSKAPVLVHADDPTQIVAGDIFHTTDASPFDWRNLLNAGGGMQVLSVEGADGSMVIGFEDLRLTQGDADFNDLVLRVTPAGDDIFPG